MTCEVGADFCVAQVDAQGAEQGVDDLTDIEGMSDEQAGALIMAARNICWFGDDA